MNPVVRVAFLLELFLLLKMSLSNVVIPCGTFLILTFFRQLEMIECDGKTNKNKNESVTRERKKVNKVKTNMGKIVWERACVFLGESVCVYVSV